MSGVWTSERVLALAPDAASASAGQGLASAKKWSGIGQSPRAVWGLCQGSGKDPYQARIDLAEPAFKCSCPSRKFPCKHGLGLMLLFAKDPASFKTVAEPGWVSEWIEGRAEKAEKKADKAKAEAAGEVKAPDPQAQAKRVAARESKVAAGVAECSTWLEDLARRGLAAAKGEAPSWWERTAARMVDAQSTGLAALVRSIAEATQSGDDWEARTLEVIGRTRLLLTAAGKLDTLPPDLAADVRVTLGWTQAKEEALAGEAVADAWGVVGQVVEEEERVRARRTWLLGAKTGRRALVLDFAVGTAPMDASLIPGMGFDGELAFYPSRLPLRAVVKSRGGATTSAAFTSHTDATIAEALNRYARALAVNPWLLRWPVVLTDAHPARIGDRWAVADRDGASLPIRAATAASLAWWRTIAACGGAPCTIAGEWDGAAFLPIGVVRDGAPLVDVVPRWVA